MIKGLLLRAKDRLIKFFRVRHYRFKQSMKLRWRRVPTQNKERYVFVGNYLLNALFLSFLILFITYWNVKWFRFVGIVPAVAIFLFYFEYYFKWVMGSYKD